MSTALKNTFEKIMVFDVETTGLDARRNTIIEFGCVEIETRGNARRETDLLIQLPPDVRLPEKITSLTGITSEKLKNEGITRQEAASTIRTMLDSPGLLLVAYNAQFDLWFLYHFLRQSGAEAALKNAKLLDAMTVYRDRKPYPHKLSDAVSAYRVRTQNTHRALDDAKATWELLEAMGEEEDDLLRYLNLFGYLPKYGVSGQKIASVTYRPQGYRGAGKLYET